MKGKVIHQGWLNSKKNIAKIKLSHMNLILNAFINTIIPASVGMADGSMPSVQLWKYEIIYYKMP